MPPNFSDVSPPTQIDFVDGPPKDTAAAPEPTSSQAALKVVRSVTTLATHMLIGIVVGSLLLATVRFMTPGATKTHIILCVIGFQMLMAEGILCLAPDSWCSTLSLKHQRWVHTGLQLGGAILALVGCFIKVVDTGVNFQTYHGQFALASMVFTTISLVNGCASLFAYELRKCIPSIVSRLTHICFGTVALITASISLCFGMNYVWFVSFLSREYANALLVMVGALTTIVIINPLLTFYAKFSGAISS
ncbi:hypothetical protein ABMA28_003731 [Loxostege sticticalis]|uniref:ascorbate ferrireductase (transmembrane) n=1 Tax=Loxostege sticticalis TaxID=481309 RepID=A0ABD0SX92_LOXSC